MGCILAALIIDLDLVFLVETKLSIINFLARLTRIPKYFCTNKKCMTLKSLNVNENHDNVQERISSLGLIGT